MTLAEFLLKLAQDPDLYRDFQSSPSRRDELLRENGISDSEAAILRTGDLRSIRVRVEADVGITGAPPPVAPPPGGDSVTVWTFKTVWAPPPPPPPGDES